MTTPSEQLAHLRADAESGALAGLCERLGIGLLVVFGSVLARPESAGDLDLACAAADGSRLDRMRVLDALEQRYGIGLDLMPLDQAGPVARYAALGPGELLYESEPGRFARAQMAAFGIYRDTQKMRDLQLEVLLG
ncbi:hypothetical protein AAEX63_04935 [Luteococcus sp. H138]|uniref:nucleotidyltransferase family protein n=1 Tax=unclassified Luteococcus TaxID=2639923 RepID=UPI00313C15E8